MRACQPDRSGTVCRDGIRVGYDVYGAAHAGTVLLLPTWLIATAEHWKFQVPVLARRYRVVTVDPRGNGRSDRPTDPAAYQFAEQVADALAVLDELGVASATAAGVSCGGNVATLLAATAPDRVDGVVVVAPALWPLAPPLPPRRGYDFAQDYGEDADGWALYNAHAWRRDRQRFARFFWGEIFPEPHSSKPVEDGVGWTSLTDAEAMIATQTTCELAFSDRAACLAMLERIRCPVLVVHGTEDRISPLARSETVAEVTGGDLLLVDGGGHCPQVRDPVVVNRALADFLDRVTPPRLRAARRTTWTRARSRPRRVLYLCSPIGLGHARRDLAIARELRAARPEVQVDWLAQHPVTTFLDAAGEHAHPASALLASESAHIDSEAREHDLHAFQAIRRMDEILLANFTVAQDLLDSGDYDLVVGDEAWDLDHFWHDNPELKRTAYCWMTDFVGWLPMPDGGAAEAALTADYNAEMIEQVERFGRVRDRSVFIGDPDDVVPDDFGPGLPAIREWTERHYDFAGYVTGLDAAVASDRAALRRRLGHPVDAPLVVVTVGGSGVGGALLGKVVEAFPRLAKEVDGLRMLVVAGPRVDTGALPTHPGVEVRGYVADLPLHLAACDAAIVQGGLTTTMELVAAGRPFLYFPLGHHFEQQRHVRHRLDRHRAGRCLDYARTDADDIAAALAEELAAPVDYLPVPGDGAARAARLVAELI